MARETFKEPDLDQVGFVPRDFKRVQVGKRERGSLRHPNDYQPQWWRELLSRETREALEGDE